MFIFLNELGVPSIRCNIVQVNYHLKRANPPTDRRMNNFGSDIKVEVYYLSQVIILLTLYVVVGSQDSEIYSVLMNQLDGTKCPLISSSLTAKERATMVIRHATAGW